MESHWTDQVQNQQRRIAAVLAVNGFLLAFLATGGLLQFYGQPQSGWYRYPLDICLILLTIGLIFGVVALVPRIPITRPDKSVEPTRPEESGDLFFDAKPAYAAAVLAATNSPARDRDTERMEPSALPAKSPAWLWFSRRWEWLVGNLKVDRDPLISKPGSLDNAWLNATVFWNSVKEIVSRPARGFDLILYQLCESCALNSQGNRTHKQVNEERRTMMNCDIVFVMAALLFLIVAICGRMAA
jgi:hypothetical protein